MLKTKTMPDKTKAKIYYKSKDDQYQTFKQRVVEVFKNEVKVVSGKGNKYNVLLSDRVKMTMNVKVDDMAVVMPLENGWLVVDIVPAENDGEDEYSVLIKKKFDGSATGADLERLDWLNKNDVELQRQMQEFEDMFGGY